MKRFLTRFSRGIRDVPSFKIIMELIIQHPIGIDDTKQDSIAKERAQHHYPRSGTPIGWWFMVVVGVDCLHLG